MELFVDEYGTYKRPQNNVVGYINSVCNDFSYKFYSGIYFLQGEVDCGAWSFACSLLDASYIKEENYGKLLSNGTNFKSITLNGKNIDYTNFAEIANLSFHVGQYKMYKKKTFGLVLRETLKKSKSTYTVDELVDKFELLPEFLDQEIRTLNMRMWGCFPAIGFAQNKKIFVFPWLSKMYFPSTILFRVCRVLSKEDVIVLVPCSEKIKIPTEEKFNVVRMNSLFKFDYENIDN